MKKFRISKGKKMPLQNLKLGELKKPEFTNFTVSLPFTSFRCSVIASKIKKNP